MVKRKQHTPKRASETCDNYAWECRRLINAQSGQQVVFENNECKKRTKLGNNTCLPDSVLQLKLSECHFYLKIDRSISDRSGLSLGTVILDVECNSIPQCSEFWLYVSSEPCKSFLYFEVNDSIKYYTVLETLDTEFYSALSRKCFTLKFEGFDSDTRKMTILVYVTETECQKLQQKHHIPEMQIVMSYLYQIPIPECVNEGYMTNHNVQELYDAVKQAHHVTDYCVTCTVEHVDLKPKLRPYQIQAVHWMLGRETQSHVTGQEEELHCLYTELRLQDGRLVYFSKHSGHIVLEKPLAKPLPTGGILADEMGLGKTVEILALILLNPRKDVPVCTDFYDNVVKTLPVDVTSTSDETVLEVARFAAVTRNERVVSGARKDVKGRVRKVSNKSKRRKVTKKTVKDATSSDCKKPKKKVSQLRNLLQTWYNEVLSGMDRKPVEQIKVSVHCPCGQERVEEERVRCSTCARWQHQKCVNFVAARGHRYFCPQCWQNKEPVVSGCSLIVTPNSICNQWVDEIHMHISNKNFKVLVYKGVTNMGFIQPYEMMEYDVVITTYETLRKELDFDVNGAKHKTLRHEKRFVSPPSPLSCVSWWRICLDEAQMVEGACKAAEMVQRLLTTHRWAITGTPVQKTFQGTRFYASLHNVIFEGDG